MKFLVDANLSPRVARTLTGRGFESTHVADIGLLTASDEAIFERAAQDNSVIITADSDFAALLALGHGAKPSVVQLRHLSERSVDEHIDMLVANLPSVIDDLGRGAIVSLSPTRLAVRDLPIP